MPACVCVRALMTDRSHNAREAPLSAEQSVAVQASSCIQAAVQHVHPDHVRVHGVRVLPHGGLDHRLPRVAAHRDRVTVGNKREFDSHWMNSAGKAFDKLSV